MGQFYDQNKDSNLNVLEHELTGAHAEALNDPSNIEDFVQMLGLIMNKTTRISVTQQQINYVTSRLLNNQEKASLGTGEGKSSAQMLLLAAQEMLYQRVSLEETNAQVLKRNLESFHDFFNILGINIELNSVDEASSHVTPHRPIR